MDDSLQNENHENDEDEFWQLVLVAQAAIIYQEKYINNEPYTTSSYIAKCMIKRIDGRRC